MEIEINKEDLSLADGGGGYKTIKATIFIDSTLPLIRQKKILIYEILGAFLDQNEHQPDFIDEISEAILEGLDEIEEDEHQRL